MRRLAATAALVAGLAASGATTVLAAMLTPPLGAVQIDNDLFMRSMGLDGTGCDAYEPWSPTRAVDHSIHYRRADGSFTKERAEASCAATRTTDAS